MRVKYGTLDFHGGNTAVDVFDQAAGGANTWLESELGALQKVFCAPTEAIRRRQLPGHGPVYYVPAPPFVAWLGKQLYDDDD